MKLAALAAALLLLTGCQPTITGTPKPEPQKVHCNLIFPGPSRS